MLSVSINWEFGITYSTACNNELVNYDGIYIYNDVLLAWTIDLCHYDYFDLELNKLGRAYLKFPVKDILSSNKGLLFVSDNKIINSDFTYEIDLDNILDVEHYCDDKFFILTDNSIYLYNLHNQLLDKLVELDNLKISSIKYVEDLNIIVLTSTADNMLFCYEVQNKIIKPFFKTNFEKFSSNLLLNAPRNISYSDKQFFIADSNNNRVIVYSLGEDLPVKKIYSIVNKNSYELLWRPLDLINFLDRIYILDSKNRRIICIDSDNNLLFSTKKDVILKSRTLKHPRAINLQENMLYICDSHNDRILKLNIDNLYHHVIRNNVPWVRDICIKDNLFYYVSSLNGAIYKSKIDDGVCNFEIVEKKLSDPHQYRIFEDKTLIVNSGSNEIFFTNSNSRLIFSTILGKNLSDPHSADFTYDNGLIIADTGNNRIVFSNNSYDKWFEINKLKSISGIFKISQPRFVARYFDNTYILIDTGSKSIVNFDLEGNLIWIVGEKSQLNKYDRENFFCWNDKLFHDPRWVIYPKKDELIVSDTGNCRIVSINFK